MWYFNGSNFNLNQERIFNSILNSKVLKISDEYEVMFPDGKFEDSNPFFNGYEILVGNNKVIKKRIDKFETGNWITYLGKIDEILKIELNGFLENEKIFSIKFISNGNEIFEINDFNEYIIYDSEVLKSFNMFKNIIDEVNI